MSSVSAYHKAAAKRVKAAGLQKLKYYCSLCRKQCRDANGFSSHCASASHARQMEIFRADPETVLSTNSRDFERTFLQLMSTRFAHRNVKANTVYQELILSDRDHVHLNSTTWPTLGDFTAHLAKEGKIRLIDEVDEDGDATGSCWIRLQSVFDDIDGRSPSSASTRDASSRLLAAIPRSANMATDMNRLLYALEEQMSLAAAESFASAENRSGATAATAAEEQEEEEEEEEEETSEEKQTAAAVLSPSLGSKRSRPAVSFEQGSFSSFSSDVAKISDADRRKALASSTNDAADGASASSSTKPISVSLRLAPAAAACGMYLPRNTSAAQPRHQPPAIAAAKEQPLQCCYFPGCLVRLLESSSLPSAYRRKVARVVSFDAVSQMLAVVLQPSSATAPPLPSSMSSVDMNGEEVARGGEDDPILVAADRVQHVPVAVGGLAMVVAVGPHCGRPGIVRSISSRGAALQLIYTGEVLEFPPSDFTKQDRPSPS